MYFYSPLFKKPKKPEASGAIVDLSAGLLSAEMLRATDIGHDRSWGSEIESKKSSMNRLSDVENLRNTIAEETSYIDSNAFEMDNIIDNATPKKTRMRTYVLVQPPKAPSFVNTSNNNSKLVFLVPKFVGSNQLPSAESHALKKRNFEPVKSFALDVELSAVPGKTNRVSTPSKFLGIIKSSFTSELSLKKARELAVHEKIVVNVDVKQVNKLTNWVIVVKEILVNLPKSAVEFVFSKFGKIVSIKMQLIGLWQKALVKYESSEIAELVMTNWSVFIGKNSVRMVSRDQHQALLYTLSVGTTAHDLSGLLDLYGRKTCFIGHNPNFYVRNRYAVVCFVDEASKLAVIGFVPVFKSMSLHWASLLLACCAKCRQFGHVSDMCLVGGNSEVCRKQVVIDQDQIHLAGIYKKKQAPIARPVSFVTLGVDSVSGANSSSLASTSFVVSELNDHLAALKCSLEILSKQVFGILRKLSFVELVSLAPSSCALSLAVLVPVASVLDSNMAIDDMLMSSPLSLLGVGELVNGFSSSSSKILTSKVGGLKSKMLVLEVSVGSVLAKLDILCSDSDLLLLLFS
ncbi:hypothetical protein G9A89_006126 [Geosiphon pyriformis]|nr:hypothetical protein G9A89_006126 [Geosiphon pyriformis]